MARGAAPETGYLDFDGFFIDGAIRPAHGADRFEVVDPATEQPVGKAPAATRADVDDAVAAARRAFDASPWRETTVAERADMLRRLAAALAARNDEMAAVVTRENGTVYAASRWMTGWRQCETYARLADEVPWEERRTGAVGPGLVRREPVGVCALIVPWNAPLALLLTKLAPALLAGCTVVAKPSPETPLDTYLLADAVMEAGLPAGVVNIVAGDAEVGDYLVRHPGVDKVSFTGSVRAGRQIMAACAERFTRVMLELGGKSASVILDDADLDDAVRGTVQGFTFNNGQACVALSRTLVPRSLYDDVVDRLAAAASSLVVGDPLARETAVGPLTGPRQFDRVSGFIDIARQEGARVVAGGRRPPGLDRGWFFEPTVLADVHNDMRVAREEIFGPVTCVIPYDDVNEAVAIANDSPYGLCGAVWSGDVERATEVARAMRTGTVSVNAFVLDPELPFGGYKESGIGRQNGPEGLEPFFEYKSISLPA